MIWVGGGGGIAVLANPLETVLSLYCGGRWRVPERSGRHSSGFWDTPRLLMRGGFLLRVRPRPEPPRAGRKAAVGVGDGRFFFFFFITTVLGAREGGGRWQTARPALGSPWRGRAGAGTWFRGRASEPFRVRARVGPGGGAPRRSRSQSPATARAPSRPGRQRWGEGGARIPLALRSLARRGAGGGGSVSHGDSRFRCRKGGSAGGGRGEEARLFTRLKRAWGCIPRLPETCLSLPPAEALCKRQRRTERWAGSRGVLLEPHGNQRDTPQKHPKAALKPTTHTHRSLTSMVLL